MSSTYSFGSFFGGSDNDKDLSAGHTTEAPNQNQRYHDQRSIPPSDHNNAPKSTTFTLIACTALTLALTAKTIRSSRRARHARYDAQAWKRVSLSLIDRGNRMNHLRRLDDGVSRGGRECFESDKVIRTGRKPPGGLVNPISRETLPPREEREWMDSTGKVMNGDRAQWWKQMEELKHQEMKPQEIEKIKSSDQIREKKRIPTSTRSLYSAIHPHEDWDWKPADHPRARQPWKPTRLPPWSIGFTSAPKSSASITPTKAEATPVSTTTTTTPTSQLQKEISEEDTLEDWLIRSAIWPQSDPLKASDSAFIVQELFKEESAKQHRPQPAPSPTSPPTKEEDRIKIQALEQQIWALLHRAQALEEKLKTK